SQHPGEARYTDSVATARLENDLRCTITGADGASVTTDMPRSVGGRGQNPSPGWFWRAATAGCVATVTAMRAAREGVELSNLEVTVDSESDDRGILGMDDSVPAGPLSMRIRVRIVAPEADADQLRELASWGSDHCPMCDGIKRAVPVTLEIETG
ncbi:MAG TPA: OsmC family protein, partial [Actinomycetota bacterium]|nr:OsmC family protein [Actinomycetota bacterium]